MIPHFVIRFVIITERTRTQGLEPRTQNLGPSIQDPGPEVQISDPRTQDLRPQNIFCYMEIFIIN